MSENPASNNCCNSRLEYTGAFLLLRLWLGLRTLLAGVEKFESGGSYSFENYYKNMGRMAQGITSASFMPLWMTKFYAMSLGYLLVLLGLAVLLGIKSRVSLFVTGLLYVSLSFGLMAVQEGEGVAWLGMHMVMFAGALLLVKYERLALWADQNN
ncbi:MAG: DoxX family membrane protein [Verrucomicrobia bacterium]|nr:DoxX family membrane protein [Verrucomicrobiota bacterium]